MKASVVAAVKGNFFSSWFEICHLTHTTAGFMAWYCTARRLFIKKKLLQRKYIVQFASCTCSRCLAGNLIVNIVTPWFDLPVIWKAGPVFGLQISPTVFFLHLAKWNGKWRRYKSASRTKDISLQRSGCLFLQDIAHDFAYGRLGQSYVYVWAIVHVYACRWGNICVHIKHVRLQESVFLQGLLLVSVYDSPGANAIQSRE